MGLPIGFLAGRSNPSSTILRAALDANPDPHWLRANHQPTLIAGVNGASKVAGHTQSGVADETR